MARTIWQYWGYEGNNFIWLFFVIKIYSQVDPPFPHPHNSIEPSRRQTRIVPTGTACLLAAWGRQTAATLLFRARQVQVQQPILSNSDCALVTTPNANRITDNMICATSVNQGPCVGNLGSGLYCDGILTGILTGGIGCGAANTPAVYHQTRIYRDWIDQQITRFDEVVPGSRPFDNEGFPGNMPRN